MSSIPTSDTRVVINLVDQPLAPKDWFLVMFPTVLGNDTPTTLFGAAWDAPITIRWPTLDDHTAIDGKLNVYAKTKGLVDANELSDLNFLLALSLFFFEHLKAAALPAWLSKDAPTNPRQQLAILRAYELAQAALADEKKSAAPSGSNGSTS